MRGEKIKKLIIGHTKNLLIIIIIIYFLCTYVSSLSFLFSLLTRVLIRIIK
jgi:hypothetical protein